jgi:alanine racemase
VARRALARVNLAAIERNVVVLRSGLTGDAVLCAVVKADASGHGAAPVARAALAQGATMLAVATADEAAQLRAAGLSVPVLVMGAISDEELPVALAAGAEVVAWNERFVHALLAEDPVTPPVRVHVKLDTGMGRLGTRAGAEAWAVAELVASHAPELELAGAMTHFATADEDLEFVEAQLAVFAPFADRLHRRVPRLAVHAANSAATLSVPGSHFDMVRCGIALYGCDPMNREPDAAGLEPALELSSYVAAIKLTQAGESVGYGRRFIAERETLIATLPIGYADGIRRALSNNCDVLIGGRRYPLVGTVSMDNVTVDLTPVAPIASAGRPAAPVRVGDTAVLIGRSGAERQTVEDLANRIGTVAHEILCGISARVPRQYHRDGGAA